MQYELRLFDRRHHLMQRFAFRAPDDVEATGAAEDLAEPEAAELWCGHRLVRAWPAFRSRRNILTYLG